MRYIFRDEPTTCPGCLRSVNATRRSDEQVFRVSRHLFGEASANKDGFHELDAGGFCPGSLELAPARPEPKRARR